MVGLPYDFLVNPLGAVRSTFEKALATGSDPASFDGKDWGALDLFRQFLFDQGGLSRVPVLTPTTIRWIKPNMLVRFRGMIQDMLGNEFYVGAYKDGSVWRTNKFIDVSQFSMNDSADMLIWERRLLYCVPVPGQNAWTEISSEAVGNDCMDWASQQREKRRRTDNESADCVDMTRDDQHPSPASEFGAAVTEGTSSSMSMVCGPDANSLPCLVKIYDSPESDLKLNDVFEFVGVLTSDQEPHVDKDFEFSNGFCEGPSLQFLHNKVPLLHCFVYRKLAAQDFLKNNPMAEVHTRVDAVAVGKLSLNLTSFKKETTSIYGNRLSVAVKDLLPFTHCIPLTVDYLNSTSLAPKKDYDTNRLTTGVLQLAEGSHVIVDETKLEAGILNSVGVENTRLLKNLMQLQKVEYDFKYYKMEMAADVQLLILSEGKSNILPADVVVPFRPSSVASSEAITAEALEAWRWYLATVRLLPYTIKSEIQKVVENDLVAAMQADRSLSPDDFSRWLTMGRLISLSFGETCLSLEHWEMVKELEKLRRERLK
ncbi:hypothetical protein L6164_030188 [Bauhinia variegata]|uniref:Uncharacterized protein n=1 Tax=Bauhinia variegata TaxID=167791 RepID=A0ACB9LCE1_BAUVA|nr:hypothetical protein L6164_030188 [Bauhinia variegata]